MSNVVPFKSDEYRIFVCLCGCSSFNIRDDGATQCCACGVVSKDSDIPGSWFDESLKNPTRDTDDDFPFNETQGNGRAEFAHRVALRRASEEGCVLIMSVDKDARVSVWTAIDNETQVQWAERRIASGFDLIRRQNETLG